jgi:sulfite exporter TauE/SafE
MIPPNEVLITVLISSILGSLHCVGMCGSLVALCCVSGSANENRITRILSETAYHVMRLTSYLILGYLAGAIGKATHQIINIAGFQRGFGIIAGTLLILWGFRDIGVLSYISDKFNSISGIQYALGSRIMSIGIFQYPLKSKGISRGAFVGLMSGLLPCGWLYAYVITAAGTQNPVSGIWIMGFFWAGTVPSLFIFARVLKKLDNLWLKRIPKLTAIMIIVLGLLAISGRLAMIQDNDLKNTGESASCH